jgi:hypothetical protein
VTSIAVILRKLRPPCLQPVQVAYSYSAVEPTNYGLTLAVATGVPLVAPGQGSVDFISGLGGGWRTGAPPARAVAVRIDHGLGIKTWVHGLTEAACSYGPIERGQWLGPAQGPFVFFAIEAHGVFYDPAHVNSSFMIQDGVLNLGKAGMLRQAPDVITTFFSDVISVLGNGVRYFFPPQPRRVRFALDFNGQGTKDGAAVIGDPEDQWEDIPPIEYNILPPEPPPYGAPGLVPGLAPLPPGSGYGYGYSVPGCPGGMLLPAAQGFFLKDVIGTPSKVYFERLRMSGQGGISPFFDPMLSSWVGGYQGPTPLINTFSLRNLPAGLYDVYVYTNGGATADPTVVYFSSDTSAPTWQRATPTLNAGWIEGANYLKESLNVARRGKVTLLVYGYLAGLQLDRTVV